MKKNMILKTGIIGMVISALCCFTPLLTMLLGALGLASWVGYLDIVLMPALIFFAAMTVYAFYKKKACCTAKDGADQA